MLYSVILGNGNINNVWKVQKDDYGNSYIENSAIHQRIRYGKNVTPILRYLRPDENDTRDVADWCNVSTYELPEHIFFSNNNKNMNLNIVNFWTKDKEVLENHNDDNLVYITLSSSSYKLLEYVASPDVEIVQTYHMNKGYVGCAITVPCDMKDFITIQCRDFAAKKYITFKISLVDGNLSIEYDDTVSKDDIKKLSGLNKKFSNFNVGFKMQYKNGKLVTKTYIVSAHRLEDAKKMTAHIKDPVIIVLENSRVDGFNEDDAMILRQNILDDKVRAVTLYGIKQLPKTFCKDYKILYMFDYDYKRHGLDCVRSN